jgi:hypothetical protein
MTGTEITERLHQITQRVNATHVGPFAVKYEEDCSTCYLEDPQGTLVACIDTAARETVELFAHSRTDLPFLLNLVALLIAQLERPEDAV